jgi:hypothetical protein
VHSKHLQNILKIKHAGNAHSGNTDILDHLTAIKGTHTKRNYSEYQLMRKLNMSSATNKSENPGLPTSIQAAIFCFAICFIAT